MEKTHWKKAFNSDYLGSCDIDDGTDLKAIIKEVVVKKVKNTVSNKIKNENNLKRYPIIRAIPATISLYKRLEKCCSSNLYQK